MTLTQHTKLTGVAALLLFPFWNGTQLFWFAVGSILIDIDHYIFYVLRCRRFDIRGMFRYFDDLQEIQKSIPYAGLCIFHTLDFFVLIGLLALYRPFFFYLLAGLLFHLPWTSCVCTDAGSSSAGRSSSSSISSGNAATQPITPTAETTGATGDHPAASSSPVQRW